MNAKPGMGERKGGDGSCYPLESRCARLWVEHCIFDISVSSLFFKLNYYLRRLALDWGTADDLIRSTGK